MKRSIQIHDRTISANDQDNLLEILRNNGFAPDAPCGGNGKCGKCRVRVNGEVVLACQYQVASDITVDLSNQQSHRILTEAASVSFSADPIAEGYLVAFDIGTTTVVCYLMSAEGEELAVHSMLNPQTPYGADVISRIQRAVKGELASLTTVIRNGMTDLILSCCADAAIRPEQIGVVSVVGNSCIQQIFLGIPVDNLAAIPFAPVITEAKTVCAGTFLPIVSNAKLIIVPNISGFVGSDTVGCVIASKMYESHKTVLMVDIGTNGELVLVHKGRMVACSTAAGPALEGANIQFGMRGCDGAIDHVFEDGCTVIGGGEAVGICGSGLIDAAAVMLEKGILNKRGRVLTEDRNFYITPHVYLTQDDIRQLQMAKGSIAAGICMMARYLGITVSQIDRVILAGAFGSYLNPDNACRIGLLPEELAGKITAAGNIAGRGSKMLAANRQMLLLAQRLAADIEFLELASQPDFQRAFAKNMAFRAKENR